MYMKTVLDRVIEVVMKLTIVEEITGYDQALSELGFDSLKKVNLIIEIENEFEIRCDDSELNPKNLSSIKDLVNLVEKNIGD
jgi:acyl carrier protein